VLEFFSLVALDVSTTDGYMINWKGINSAVTRFRMRSDQEILVAGSGLSHVESVNTAEISSHEWRMFET
jgi:hypothetical protein